MTLGQGAGRQFPIEASTSDLALFCTHLADASFLTPADSFWLLVPVRGNPVLQRLPLLCLWLCSPQWADRDQPLLTMNLESQYVKALWRPLPGYPHFADGEIKVLRGRVTCLTMLTQLA